MPAAVNFLDSPLDAVDCIFSTHYEKCGKSIEDVKNVIQNQFKMEFADIKKFFKVPSLNVKSEANLKPNSLVRFRCMIQDMKDPEFFTPVIQVEHKQKPGFDVRTGLFRDSINCAPDCEVLSTVDGSASERHVFNCISIPGETNWVKKDFFRLEEGFAFDDNKEISTCLSSGVVKRQRETDEHDFEMENCAENSKKVRLDNEPPLARDTVICGDNASFVVKVYFDGDSFKLNDMVEFLGVFTKDDDGNLEGNDQGMAVETCCLHALFARKLNHLNPKLFDKQTSFEELIQSNYLDLKDVRDKLHKFLTVQLLGDELAAEFLICHMVSFVMHKDAMALGKFSLNLFNVPSDATFIANLYETMTQLVTKSLYLPLNLTDLNSVAFVPKKDYERERLLTGRLQLSDGTFVIVDETKLEVGQLIEQGVKNIAAVQSVISNQWLDYDFHYHSVNFKTNINVLILSEGLSCLPSDCALPMQISFTPANFSIGKTDESLFETFRDYLTLVRFPELKIDEGMQQIIREDFAEMRRKNDEINASKLHELLVLARWVSYSFGTNCLTEELWAKSKAMDEARRRRVIAK